jgi:hypothetical protein
VASCTLAIMFDIILLALTSAAFEEMRPISDAHSKGLLSGVLISSLVLLPVNILLFIAEVSSSGPKDEPIHVQPI